MQLTHKTGVIVKEQSEQGQAEANKITQVRNDEGLN